MKEIKIECDLCHKKDRINKDLVNEILDNFYIEPRLGVTSKGKNSKIRKHNTFFNDLEHICFECMGIITEKITELEKNIINHSKKS